MELNLKTNSTISLELLTYPSFALPLFDVSEKQLVKRYGFCNGLKINAFPNGYTVYHENSVCLEYSKLILGLWFDPWLYVSEVTSVFKPIVQALLELYPGFSLSVSPLDDLAILTSIILSKRTDYHVNTVRWLRTLIDVYGDLSRLTLVDLRELLDVVGASFQLRELPQLISCYMRVRDEVLKDSRSARRLLECRGVGPKTLYSYILHVLLDTSYAPVDVNLEVFLDNMGFKGLGFKPNRRHCMVYDCSFCPLRSSCIEGRLREGLGRLTGWFQTIAYVHVKRFCRRGACGECSLRDLCVRSSRQGPL